MRFVWKISFIKSETIHFHTQSMRFWSYATIRLSRIVENLSRFLQHARVRSWAIAFRSAMTFAIRHSVRFVHTAGEDISTKATLYILYIYIYIYLRRFTPCDVVCTLVHDGCQKAIYIYARFLQSLNGTYQRWHVTSFSNALKVVAFNKETIYKEMRTPDTCQIR